MPRALRWVIALLGGIAIAWPISLALTDALKPREVKNWEAGRPVFDRQLPQSVAEGLVQDIQRERRVRQIEARAPNEATIVMGRFLVSLPDPIDLAILAFVTFVIAKLLPRWRAKAALRRCTDQGPH
ncbi:MAG TPA: hypothetical protein VII63_05605 [Caulobacteraceae bacterium]